MVNLGKLLIPQYTLFKYMGYKGKKARLKNFQERANQFEHEVETRRQKNTTLISRDDRPLIIGIRFNKRLALKSKPHQTLLANKITQILKEYFAKNGIKGKTFELVETASNAKGSVQEYFNKPTIPALLEYIESKQEGKKPNLSLEDYTLCKQFINQRRNYFVTPDKLYLAALEFNAHLNTIREGLGRVLPSNLVVLGITRQRKIRLALVDI